jgi:hypothetical protein
MAVEIMLDTEPFDSFIESVLALVKRPGGGSEALDRLVAFLEGSSELSRLERVAVPATGANNLLRFTLYPSTRFRELVAALATDEGDALVA